MLTSPLENASEQQGIKFFFDSAHWLKLCFEKSFAVAFFAYIQHFLLLMLYIQKHYPEMLLAKSTIKQFHVKTTLVFINP